MNLWAVPDPAEALAADGGALSPCRDLEAEAHLVGAALVSDRIVEPVATEIGIRPEHFADKTNARIWTAATSILDQGDRVDVAAIDHHLAGTVDRAWLEHLAAAVPSVANAKAYARRILDAHRWERRRDAHLRALAAVRDRDEPALHAAEADATRVIARRGADHATTGRRLGEQLARDWSQPRRPGLPLPWPTLANSLRARRGQTTVLGGHTNMGKSHVAQLLAEHVGRNQLHAVIWSNEMNRDELVARTVQRATGVPDHKILDGEIPPDDAGAVLETLRDLPYGVVEAHGWSAEEIGRHIRHVKPDLAILDHFHQLPGSNRTDTADDAVIALTTAAAQADTHLLVVCQLNHSRDNQLVRTAPALRDLRSTGLLQHLPNNVLLFHRDEEELTDQSGRKLGRAVVTNNGTLHLAKQRGGPRDKFTQITFDPARLVVEEKPTWPA